MRHALLRDRLLTTTGLAAALGLAGLIAFSAVGCGAETDPVGDAIADA